MEYVPKLTWAMLAQTWKKLHAAHAVRADIFFRIEDILVYKSRTFVRIADFSGD